jgi:hypothetical protein
MGTPCLRALSAMGVSEGSNVPSLDESGIIGYLSSLGTGGNCWGDESNSRSSGGSSLVVV